MAAAALALWRLLHILRLLFSNGLVGCRAVTACILRGSAYQSDVADLLEHPIARIESVQRVGTDVLPRLFIKDRDYDMVGHGL